MQSTPLVSCHATHSSGSPALAQPTTFTLCHRLRTTPLLVSCARAGFAIVAAVALGACASSSESSPPASAGGGGEPGQPDAAYDGTTGNESDVGEVPGD